MSESAPERSAGGSAFKRKVGPLPLWGWMAIIGALAVFYALYSKQKAAAANAQSANSSTVDSPGGVDSSLVPQFVNQVYTQSTPPPAPNITVNTPPPNTGTTGTTTASKVHQYPQPQGFSTSKVSATSLKASWNNVTSPMPAPQSYTVAVYQGGKTVAQQTVNAPDTVGGKSTVTLTGLPANAKNLQVHVWANGGALAPPHASSTVSL